MSTNVETVLNTYVFRKEDGTVHFWDHPNLKSRLTRPKTEFRPITRIENIIEMVNNGKLSEDDMVILKVLGDAVCANEGQLRRYLKTKFSSNMIGKTLRRLAKYGYVTRVKCYIQGQDEATAPRHPAPFVLGIAGYQLLKYYYSDQYFIKDQHFAMNDFQIPLFVGTNELRVLAYESGHMRGWEWSPLRNLFTNVPSPNAALQIAFEQYKYDFLITRVYQSLEFIDHLRGQLEAYRYFYKKDQKIPRITLQEEMQQILVISVSSISIAQEIEKQLHLHNFPMHIWYCVDEWMDEATGLRHAFAQPTKDGIERLDVWFLEKKV